MRQAFSLDDLKKSKCRLLILCILEYTLYIMNVQFHFFQIFLFIVYFLSLEVRLLMETEKYLKEASEYLYGEQKERKTVSFRTDILTRKAVSC